MKSFSDVLRSMYRRPTSDALSLSRTGEIHDQSSGRTYARRPAMPVARERNDGSTKGQDA